MATTNTGGISSFLQDGKVPSGSAIVANTTENHLPDWYTNYAQQIISNQNALAAAGYQKSPVPGVAAFNDTQQNGFGQTVNAADAYQPGLNAAQGTTNAAAHAPGALNTAQPWLNRAGQSSVAHIGQYMSPYTDAVVNRIGELGQRNLTENLMPAITNKFISAGQLGLGGRGGAIAPSGMMTDTARALRDTNADILGQQTQALQQGYTQATNLAGTDLARYAQLGATTGGLANTQQQTQLNAGAQQADIAGLQQKYGLTGADAVTGVGNQMQGQDQNNLDYNNKKFAEQRDFDQTMIDKQINAIKGVSGAVPTATTEMGIKPIGTPTNSPSGVSTAVGTALSVADFLAKYGWIKP